MNPFKMISYHQKLVHKNLQEHIASFFIPSIGYRCIKFRCWIVGMRIKMQLQNRIYLIMKALITDYGRPVRKLPSLHSRKLNPNPKFLDTVEAYLVCRIGPNFQIILIYAFTVCPQSVALMLSDKKHSFDPRSNLEAKRITVQVSIHQGTYKIGFYLFLSTSAKTRTEKTFSLILTAYVTRRHF